MRPGADARAFVTTVASLRPPRTTVGGVNLVAGFRPELWRAVAPAEAPPGVTGFNEDLRGAGGYTMPATQTDLWVWFSAAAYDIVRETAGWSYKHTRDLTGFEDGTENLTLYDAPRWTALPQTAQKKVIGRTKPESTELDESVMPTDSHVSRTKAHEHGEEVPIFRRNVPYGTVTDHGTLFISFSAAELHHTGGRLTPWQRNGSRARRS